MSTRRAMLGLLAGAIGWAGCGRTEILVGVLTDIEAPGSVDQVQLRIEREGVNLNNPSWEISGVPDRPFELPGSFGVYSPDGSPVEVDLTLLGFKENVEVVRRQAHLKLVSGKTLFYRMALVKRCENSDCPDGETCIEGRCESVAVDEHTLPAYVAGLERKIDCSSGTAFIDTATGQPLPTEGDCRPDQWCGEGTCYAVAPEWRQAVRGSAGVTHVTSGGEQTVPADLSTQTVAALIPDGAGGFSTIAGSGTAQGTFRIDDVPDGTYYLQLGRDFYVSNVRQLDLGSIELGRPDPALGKTTPRYSFTVDGLQPWAAGADVLEMFTPDLLDNYLYSTTDVDAQPPADGATSLAGFTVDTISSSNPLIDGQKGDRAYLVQLHRETSTEATYLQAEGYLALPPFSDSDGQTTQLSGTLAPVAADRVYQQAFAASELRALVPAIHPNAVVDPALYGDITLDLSTRPGATAYGDVGATLDLCMATANEGFATASVACPYADLQPGWGLLAYHSVPVAVSYQLPQASAPLRLLASIRDVLDGRKDQGDGRPLLSPPRNLRIDGRAATEDQTIAANAKLTWDAPAIGEPTRYKVLFHALAVDANGATVRGADSGRLVTTDLHVFLPPGLVQPGTTYVLTVEADYEAGTSGARQPNATSVPGAIAQTLSGLLTVAGGSDSNGGVGAADAGAAPPDAGNSAPPDAGADPVSPDLAP